MAFLFRDGFDPQPVLSEDALTIRPLIERDRQELTQAASDPLIWQGHPVSDRYEERIFAPYFNMLLGANAALTIRDAEGRVIGCTVYYTDTNAPSRLSVGFTFLVRTHWGGNTNRIVKRLTLRHAFAHTSEAWFHIAPDNLRSQTATTRLGAVFTHEADIDLAGGAARWRCYCLTQESWHANDAAHRKT